MNAKEEKKIASDFALSELAKLTAKHTLIIKEIFESNNYPEQYINALLASAAILNEFSKNVNLKASTDKLTPDIRKRHNLPPASN